MIKSMNKQTTNLASGQVNQDIVEVTVAQANDIANHGHDSSGAGVGLHHLPPLPSPCAGTPQFPANAQRNPFSSNTLLAGRGQHLVRAKECSQSINTQYTPPQNKNSRSIIFWGWGGGGGGRLFYR